MDICAHWCALYVQFVYALCTLVRTLCKVGAHLCTLVCTLCTVDAHLCTLMYTLCTVGAHFLLIGAHFVRLVRMVCVLHTLSTFNADFVHALAALSHILCTQ